MSVDAESRDFEQLLARLRPRLHRYCARMTGSTLDGEDVVQEALLKAFAAHASSAPPDHAEAWLMRIAHNAGLDFLRSRARQPVMEAEDALDSIPAPEPADPHTVTASLRRFMALPVLQRSAVILKDVLEHSLQEAAAITGTSEAALKSALQRGRVQLRATAQGPEPAEALEANGLVCARLAAYVDGFKAGDFDAVRAMLAEDVRLDLVARLQRRGKAEVGEYLGRYAATGQWAFAACLIQGQPAMLVYDRLVSLATPAYFVALRIEDDRITAIRDFLFARYALELMEPRLLKDAPQPSGSSPAAPAAGGCGPCRR